MFRVADVILLIIGLAGVMAWLPGHLGAAVTVVAKRSEPSLAEFIKQSLLHPYQLIDTLTVLSV